jgi:hypothetical protein
MGDVLAVMLQLAQEMKAAPSASSPGNDALMAAVSNRGALLTAVINNQGALLEAQLKTEADGTVTVRYRTPCRSGKIDPRQLARGRPTDMPRAIGSSTRRSMLGVQLKAGGASAFASAPVSIAMHPCIEWMPVWAPRWRVHGRGVEAEWRGSWLQYGGGCGCRLAPSWRFMDTVTR